MKMNRSPASNRDVHALRLMLKLPLDRFQRMIVKRIRSSSKFKSRGLSDYQRAWCMAVVSRKITAMLRKIKLESVDFALGMSDNAGEVNHGSQGRDDAI